MIADRDEWPVEHMPVAMTFDLTATVRNNAPVAQIALHDITDDVRSFQVSEQVALSLAIELLQFVKQIQGWQG